MKRRKARKNKEKGKWSDANTEEGLKKRQRPDVNTEEDLKKETHTIEPENHTNSPAQNRQTSKTRISSIITALRLVYNPQPGVESQVKYANCYTIPTLLPPS